MLFILAALLVVAWAVGLALSFTLGGLIHLLLLAAFVLIMMRLLDGKKAVPGA